jgi:hypothetical protein
MRSNEGTASFIRYAYVVGLVNGLGISSRQAAVSAGAYPTSDMDAEANPDLSLSRQVRSSESAVPRAEIDARTPEGTDTAEPEWQVGYSQMAVLALTPPLVGRVVGMEGKMLSAEPLQKAIDLSDLLDD